MVLVCERCRTPIVDASAAVQSGGFTYCCPNCAAVATGAVTGSAGVTCSYCGVAIANPSTQVTRGGQTFCCENCASAAGKSQPGGRTVREDINITEDRRSS